MFVIRTHKHANFIGAMGLHSTAFIHPTLADAQRVS